MDRHKQRSSKRTAVTKEESLILQAESNKSVNKSLSALRRSDDKP